MSNDLIINNNPKSMFTESIKTLRTNLSFAAIDKEMKVILITSAEAGDGKSFIAANLAVAYAQENKKVLLIDCDLRRGRQHHIFNVDNPSDGGYTNLMLNYKEEMKLKDYVYKTDTPNLSLLTTGPTPPNPVELLTSTKNKKLISKFRNMYDMVILDCPPTVGLSDTTIMTTLSDANVIVVSCNKTKMESLDRLVKIFNQVNAPITGVVFNNAFSKKSGYYGYYYYNDKYHEHKKRKKKKK